MKLPFGLILKWSDRTRVEEVVAMRMARTAGMPVPRVLCCVEQPATIFGPPFVSKVFGEGREPGGEPWKT
jgi:hypothetical protein